MNEQNLSISDILLLSLSLLPAIGWFIMSKRRKKKALKGHPSNKFAKSMSGARARPVIKGKHADLIFVDDMIPLSEFDDGGEEPEPEVKEIFAKMGTPDDFLKAARDADTLIAVEALSRPYPWPTPWPTSKASKLSDERRRMTSAPMSTPFILDEVIDFCPYIFRPLSIDKDVMRCEWVFYAKAHIPGVPSFACFVDARASEKAVTEAWHDKSETKRLRDSVIKIWSDKAYNYYKGIAGALECIDKLQDVWCRFFPDSVVETDDPELDDGDAMSAQEVRALRKNVEGILWPRSKS